MYIFQVLAFVFEIIFWVLIGVIIAFNPDALISRKGNKKQSSNYIQWHCIDEGRKKYGTWNRIGRVTWFILVMTITIYFLKPYFMDIPRLIQGRFWYAYGNVYEIKRYRKDPNEYVYVGSTEVKFFFTSTMKEKEQYKVAYLPNTSRAIYAAKFNDNAGLYNEKIPFPFKEILEFAGIMAVILLLIAVLHIY